MGTDERGRVAGLHCAWDDGTGMRHGQKLEHLLAALSQPLPAAKAAKRKGGGGGKGRKRRKG